MRFKLFILLFFAAPNSYGQDMHFSFGSGIANAFEYEVIGETVAKPSVSIKFTSTFNDVDKPFEPFYDIGINWKSAAQNIDDQNYSTRLFSVNSAVGYQYSPESDFYFRLGFGPSILANAREIDSEINYLAADVFHNVQLNTMLNIGYQLTDSFSLTISETYNLTPYQKSYKSSSVNGTPFLISSGLSILTSELILNFKIGQ